MNELSVRQWALSLTYNISHKLLRPSQFLKNFLKSWYDPHCRNKSGPSPLLNLAAYEKSSNIKACAKELSQTLANNSDNGVRGIDLRIYVRYCLKKLMKSKRVFGKTWHSSCLGYAKWFYD